MLYTMKNLSFIILLSSLCAAEIHSIQDDLDKKNNISHPADDLSSMKITDDIIEPKLNGTALASLYRKYTGRRVIVSSAAANAEFSFIQEASVQNPLTYKQAAELLRKAAIIEQFVFVPHPQDPNLDILSLSSSGIRPPAIGLDIYNDQSKLPDNDSVITYVMNFDYIKPSEAVTTFTQVVGQMGSFGSIAAVPNASAIVITENCSLIKKLIELKKEIDKPLSVHETRFIQVQYADVNEITNTLTQLLSSQVSHIQIGSGAGTNGAQSRPQPAANGPQQTGDSSPVQLIAEPRTNRIFIMARPIDITFIEGLVKQFDMPNSEKTFLRKKLKFLAVSDFLPIAGDALNRAFSGNNDQNAQAQTNRGTSSNQGSSANALANGSLNQGNSSGNSRGGSTSNGSLKNPTQSAAPDSLLVGRTLLVADNITNSIVAQGPPSALSVIEQLLEQIDVKADQVMISTVFGQLSLSDDHETGLDFLVRSGDIVGRGGAGLFPALPIIENEALNPFNPGNLAAGPGLRLYGQIGDLSVYLRALQSKSNFKVLSRPSIFTANNQKGTISSGRRIAVPTNSFNSGTTGQSTNIEYRDVVLKLEVIPLVNSPNEITLQIALVSDDVIDNQTITGIGSVPIIGTREILTTVTVPNNQTVVLGGLISTNLEKRANGIPVLNQMPLIKHLFSSNAKSQKRDELMVFIQPSIVNSRESLNHNQMDMSKRYRVAKESIDFSQGNLRTHERLNDTAPHNAKKSIKPVHRR
jgi:general secretion pathway protein D